MSHIRYIEEEEEKNCTLKNNSSWSLIDEDTAFIQKFDNNIDCTLSQDSDEVPLLKNVKIRQQENFSYIWSKIGDRVIVTFSDDNLSKFIKRHPYTKNKNDKKLSKNANKLRFLEEKKQTNWYRNIFYWVKNIDVIKCLIGKEIEYYLKFVENPTIEKAMKIIDDLVMWRNGFEKYPKSLKAIEFKEKLETLWIQKKSNPLDGIDYLIKPIQEIMKYLKEIDEKKLLKKTELDMKLENTILKQKLTEVNFKIADKQESMFNMNLKKKIYEERDLDKKRNIKYNYKFK